MLKTGHINLKDGLIVIFKGHNFLFPIRSFLKLCEILIGKVGEKETDDIFKEVGTFQLLQAAQRYTVLFDLEKMEKRKFIKFGTKIFEMLGMGKYEFLNWDENNKIITVISRNVPTAIEFKMIYGKTLKPIDSFVCGVIEATFYLYFNTPMKCVETKCIACGDPYCQFEVFPVEEKRETKT